MREKKDINIGMGSRIKDAREQAKLTQERLSELVGMGPKNLSSVERGAAGLSIERLVRICEVLQVSSDKILFGVPEDHNDVQAVSDRLSKLSPAQFDVAVRMLNLLFEGFQIEK